MNDRSPKGHPDAESGERSLDREAIRSVLEEHPVRLAVLFGSQVQNTADARSDVDIAVELEPSARDDAPTVVMELLADLSIALDRNDIDLGLVNELEPRVGLAAFTHGDLLVGTPDRAESHRQTFESRVSEQSRDDLRERFDAVLDNLDSALGERA